MVNSGQDNEILMRCKLPAHTQSKFRLYTRFQLLIKLLATKMVSDAGIISRKGGQDNVCAVTKYPEVNQDTKDKALRGHVISVILLSSELQCVDLCFRHPGCVAFNFHQSEKLCELLSRFEAVVPREGFRHKIFDHSTFRAVRKKLKVFSSAMVKFHNSVLVFLKSVIRK